MRAVLIAVLLLTSLPTSAATSPSEDFLKFYDAHNYEAAFKIALPLAEAGNDYAQNFVGYMYLMGEGVPLNRDEARKWFLFSANQGNHIAQRNLGVLYRDGIGTPQDDINAIRWFRKAAELGDAIAQSNIGTAYQEGKGVLKNDEEAFKWFLTAAEPLGDPSKGDITAQYNLASSYHTGRGVARDNTKAAYWFRICADQGDGMCMASLGLLYQDGDGVPQDYGETVKWFLRAGETGYDEGKLIDGIFYIAYHVAVNREIFADTVKYLTKKAAEGHDPFRYQLASALSRGVIVAKDYFTAAVLLRSLAEEGNPVAAADLGNLYYSGGFGLQPNHAEAFHWYTKHLTAPNSFDHQYAVPVARMKLLGDGTEQSILSGIASYLHLSVAMLEELSAAIATLTLYPAYHAITGCAIHVNYSMRRDCS